MSCYCLELCDQMTEGKFLFEMAFLRWITDNLEKTLWFSWETSHVEYTGNFLVRLLQ